MFYFVFTKESKSYFTLRAYNCLYYTCFKNNNTRTQTH